MACCRRCGTGRYRPPRRRADDRHPHRRAHAPQQRLTAARERLTRARVALLRVGAVAQDLARDRLSTAANRLALQHPGVRLQASYAKLAAAQARLAQLTSQNMGRLQHQLALSGAAMAGLSPTRTLERGYVLVRALDGTHAGRVLSSVDQVPRPSQIFLSFHDGDLVAQVDAKSLDTKLPD